ncbi:MAG: bifunctional precorrin-2 dehydrogenase/sirohydrochlorin ferrochelatase [Methanosarcinales archaeon]|nr:bifunctional precorrin-2 dehydrogenase/sirohydrochlorin ferrochelatase [Methanosarcinales archaeon]
MLPLYVKVSDKRIIVFGGGSVAERKIRQILETGTDGSDGQPVIEVYSLDFTPRIEELCEKEGLRCLQCDLWDQNVEALLKDAFLILICTSDITLNEHLFTVAAKHDVLINYKDKGNVFMSSVVNKGGMLISISTGGKGPAMARYMKGKIASLIGEKEEKMLYIQTHLRDYLKEKIKDEGQRKEILNYVLSDSDCWAALDEPVDIAQQHIIRIVEDRYA